MIRKTRNRIAWSVQSASFTYHPLPEALVDFYRDEVVLLLIECPRCASLQCNNIHMISPPAYYILLLIFMGKKSLESRVDFLPAASNQDR